MYFKNEIGRLLKNKKGHLFVDMDGVITDYEFKKKLDFKNKRPIKTNIKTLKELSKNDNIELYILSVCKTNDQVKEKQEWLDKYAPFFKQNNRIILSKESKANSHSMNLKLDYLKSFPLKEKEIIIVIDDDDTILTYLYDNMKNIILFQDSSIID